MPMMEILTVFESLWKWTHLARTGNSPARFDVSIRKTVISFGDFPWHCHVWWRLPFFPRMPMNIFARGWPQPKNTIVSPWHILEIRIEAEKFEEISWGFCKLTSNMISSKKNVPKNIAVFRKAKNVFLSKIETRGWPILSRTWEMFIRKRIWSTIKMVRLLVGAVGVMEQTWQEPTKIGI